MTCRCGYEFCYRCGEDWNDHKSGCGLFDGEEGDPILGLIN